VSYFTRLQQRRSKTTNQIEHRTRLGLEFISKALLAPLILKENERYGDYYILIADKYYDKQMFKNSKKFYQMTLGKMKKFMTNTSIWIKYGFCCKHLNDINGAIYAFQNTLEIDDSNTEAAIALTEFLLRQKRHDEALDVVQKSKRRRFAFLFQK
jgi:tetratricopeptide (TPR) repeat protein